MAKKIITASTDTASGFGYFLSKFWAKIKASFYTKAETDIKLKGKASTSALTDGSVTKVGTATRGSSTQPIYLSEGSPKTCSTYAGGTRITLNGTSKTGTTASFYAPTTAGSSNYILTSNGNGAPSWKNSIAVSRADLISLNLGYTDSTSAGHGGFIDFNYNGLSEEFSSRIIDLGNRLAVMGKLLIQDGGAKYLGYNSDYTLTNTDGICFIRSDSGNAITVPAGSGILNRNLYIVSTVSGSTIVYNGITPGATTASPITIYMIPNKVYHLIAYENIWYCINNIDNDSNHKTILVGSDTTLSDFYVTRIRVDNNITLTLPSSQAIGTRELLIYLMSSGQSSKIRYQVPSGQSTYTIRPFSCIKFIALDNYWYPMGNETGA